MALTVTYNPETGQNDVVSDGHVLFVGPHISGSVRLDDGTEYNITPAWIEVESQDHAEEVADKIGERFEAEGHPLHDGDEPFKYVRSTERLAVNKAKAAAAASKKKKG